MTQKNINAEKKFNLWNDELKKALEKGRNNVQVGENLLLQTEKFSVWSIHLPAGKRMPFHKHCKPYFWTALSAGKSRSYYSDGRILESKHKKNDIKYFPDLNQNNFFIHNLENIGDTTLIFTTVEFLSLSQ